MAEAKGGRDGRTAAPGEGRGWGQPPPATGGGRGGSGRPRRRFSSWMALVNGSALLCGMGFTVSGFAMVRDIDGQSLKHVRSNNHAALNDRALTGSALTPRLAWGERIRREVPGVVYAAVLQRGTNVFVAAAPSASSTASEAGLQVSIERLVRRIDWRVAHVYVTTDATVVNHFHRYVADRMAGQSMGGDIVFNDLERLYPGVRW